MLEHIGISTINYIFFVIKQLTYIFVEFKYPNWSSKRLSARPLKGSEALKKQREEAVREQNQQNQKRIPNNDGGGDDVNDDGDDDDDDTNDGFHRIDNAKASLTTWEEIPSMQGQNQNSKAKAPCV